jgi:HK97 family phage major capsid protein
MEKLTGTDIEELKGILTNMGSQYKQLIDDNAKYGKAQSETLVKLDGLTDDIVKMQKRYDDAETKRVNMEIELQKTLARHEPAKSFGDRFVEDAGLVAWIKSGGKGSYAVTLKHWLPEAKDIINLSPQLPDRLSTWAQGPRMPYGVRQLIPQGRTTAGAVEYPRELTFTNNATIVAEGAPKPKSEKTFDVVTAIVRTIAHIFKVSKQSYEDLPGLASIIEQNGIYGVKIREDNQLLNGSGVAPHIEGFNSVAVAAPAPGGTGATLIDAIGTAVFDLASKGFLADGTVVNSADWGAVAMLKNSQGNYLFANPMEYSANARVWGTTLVQSSNEAAGYFLTGAFRGNSLLLDREDVNAQVAEQNVDDFEKNMLTVRIEERLALIIYNANAFEKGVVPAGAVAAESAGGARQARRGE